MFNPWSRCLLAAAVLAAACRSTAPARIARVPDPTAQPVWGAALTEDAAAAARAAVAAAEKGDFGAAEKHQRGLPSPHPVRSLVALEVRFLKGEKVGRDARAFAESESGYGSAWGFAAVAEERDGDLREALDAARHAAQLQPSEGWSEAAQDLESKLAGGLAAEGAGLLGRGDASGALAKARDAMQVAPDFVAARVLAVRALITLNDLRGAAELVPGLPDTSEGLELKGKVAESLGQWDLAVDMYTRLPATNPRRCELIEAARTQWRLANAPPYLARALAAKPIHRRHFAAIIAFEVPTLGSDATGAVPVFEDVVRLQERLDVLMVARSGIIPGDVVARRYNPEHAVTTREFEAALDRLAKTLHRPAPRWCTGDAADCLHVPDTLDGESAAALVRVVAGGGGEPCMQR